MDVNRICSLFLVAFGLTLFPGCTSMLLPNRLEASQLTVETSGGFLSERKYRFGKWAVVDVDRSALKTKVDQGSPYWDKDFNVAKRQQYRFTVLENGAAKHRVQCAVHYAASGFVAGAFTIQKNSMLLTCRIHDPQSGAMVGRLIGRMGREGTIGTATFGKDELSVHAEFSATTKSIIKPPTAYGYVVHSEFEPVAAIQLTNDRRIWMHTALAPCLQSYTAAVLMAMAYYTNIKPKAGERF